MKEQAALVLMTGIKGNSSVENVLNRGLEANTLDILEKTRSITSLGERFLVTNSNQLIEKAREQGLNPSVIESGEDFHFGKTLFEIIENYDLDKLFYIGGGAGSLLRKKDFAKISDFIVNTQDRSLSNNFYSSDIIGFSSAKRLLKLPPPKRDNELGWLSRDIGLHPYELARTAKTLFDLDSPLDLLSLKLSQAANYRLSDYVSSLRWGKTRLREMLPQFSDQSSKIVIIGRFGGKTWSHLEESAACRIEVFSEGRGSSSGQNQSVSSTYSIIGQIFEDRGPECFLKSFSRKGTGLILDTRLLFNHKQKWPSRKERFSADLMKPENILTEYLKDLTTAALEMEETVVLGGHSLVSGSLYLLSEASWQFTEPTSSNVRPKIFPLDPN